MQPKVKIEGGAILSLKNLANKFSKSIKHALQLEGMKLKEEMAQAIRNDQMGWAKPTPLTLRMRKRFRSKNIAGIYFARFIRYRIDEGNKGYSLRVGVVDPNRKSKKARPLSKSLKVNQQKFAQGFSYTIDRDFVRKRIKAYLEARGKDWKSLSTAQKKRLRKEFLKYGVVKKAGTVVKAPPRPVDNFLYKKQREILKDIEMLYKKKLKGEKLPNDWWKRQ